MSIYDLLREEQVCRAAADAARRLGGVSCSERPGGHRYIGADVRCCECGATDPGVGERPFRQTIDFKAQVLREEPLTVWRKWSCK